MKKILLTCIMLVFVLYAWAQDRTVSGKVTDAESGEGLPGVNVLLKGTGTGVNTDIDGNYKISVPSDGGTLVFTFIGMSKQEISIGARSVIDVQLESDVQQLSEVVVTAHGIEREKRSLGYAVTEVNADKLEQRPSADVGRVLQGKVPGVNITPTSGVSGTGTNIIIRGYSSINGSNQPLFIVDGIPFNSSTNNTGNFLDDGLNASSRFLDLDPNNIESISVLKGLSATAKYGEQGRNGVILVTTKNMGSTRAKKGTEVTVNQSVFMNQIASLPKFQNTYGGGFHQNWGWFFSNWGPRFDQRDSIPHPAGTFSDPTLRSQFPDLAGTQIPYEGYPDNVNDFFRTGVVSNTNIGISGRTENTSFNGNFGYTDEQGFLVNNNVERINLGLGGQSQLSNKLTLTGSFNFISTKMQTPPMAAGNGSGTLGGGISVFADVLYTPRSLDLTNLPFEAPLDNRPVYYRAGNDIQNPYWTSKYVTSTNDVNRFTGSTGLIYDFSDNFSARYNVGIDTYNENQKYIVNRGNVQNPDIITGLYRNMNVLNTIWNHNLAFSYSKEINSDLTLAGEVGSQVRSDIFERSGIESINQLVFGFINSRNFTEHSSSSLLAGNIESRSVTNQIGVYGELIADYRNFLYANVQVRNDWFSTLEPENRTQLYPSASLSFIPTTAFDIESNTLNYLKTRIGYGTSAGFPGPYTTRTVLGTSARRFANNAGVVFPTNNISTFLGNPNLVPETHGELEFGVEGRMINNRLDFDISAYRKVTNNLITRAPIDPATGYTSTNTNIGELVNVGIEAGIGYSIIRTNDFDWNVRGNFFAYETTVTELGGGLEEIVYAGFTNRGNFAIEGEPFGIMKGSVIERDENGNRVVGSNGDYIFADDIGIIGDPNPDFNLTGINTITWKGFIFSMQWDYVHGGDIYSTTARTMLARGLSTDTEFDRDQLIILPGVKQESGEPNDVAITSTQAYFANIGFGPDEVSVWDGTTIRLRELSLGYSLPKSIMNKTPFGNASISLSGNNLWFRAVNFPPGVNMDTEVLSLGVGNGLGFDYLTGPSSRRYGASIKFTF